MLNHTCCKCHRCITTSDKKGIIVWYFSFLYTRPLRFDDFGWAIVKSWPTQVPEDCREILSVQLDPSSVSKDPPSDTNPAPRTLADLSGISTCRARSSKQCARNLFQWDLIRQATATTRITLNITTKAISGPLRAFSFSFGGFSQGNEVDMHFPLQQYSSRLPGEPQCSSREHDMLQDRRQ